MRTIELNNGTVVSVSDQEATDAIASGKAVPTDKAPTKKKAAAAAPENVAAAAAPEVK